MKLWAMRTEPLSAAEADRLLMGLPVTLQEKLRAADPVKRQQSVWAYSLLRYALQSDYGLEMPDITWSETGKPYFLEENGLFFNISHTEGAVLVGLSDRELGVDLEKDRKAPARLQNILQADQPFFAAWVQWEACAKCLGVSVLSLLRKGVLPEEVAYHGVEIFPGYWAGAAVSGHKVAPVLQFAEMETILEWCMKTARD